MLKILAEEHALGYNAAQTHVVKFINVEGSQKLMMHNLTQLSTTNARFQTYQYIEAMIKKQENSQAMKP